MIGTEANEEKRKIFRLIISEKFVASKSVGVNSIVTKFEQINHPTEIMSDISYFTKLILRQCHSLMNGFTFDLEENLGASRKLFKQF